MQLSFHPVAVVPTLVPKKNKNKIYVNETTQNTVNTSTHYQNTDTVTKHLYITQTTHTHNNI